MLQDIKQVDEDHNSWNKAVQKALKMPNEEGVYRWGFLGAGKIAEDFATGELLGLLKTF